MLGYIAGSNTKADLSAPCRTTTYPREIPKLSWYWRLMPQMVLAGVLPFCAIYHELYYALRSYWGYTVWPKASMMVLMYNTCGRVMCCLAWLGSRLLSMLLSSKTSP